MRNKNIGLLNLHAALQRYASKTLDVFGGVYFLSHGVSFPAVALMWTASFVARFFMRPMSVWLSSKIGLKRALIVGILATSGLFLVFNRVDGINGWLIVFAIYLAFYDILYWLPYHSLYAASGEEERRGKHIAMGVGLVNTVQILMPFIGAILATKFGFNYLYISATVCMALSALPVFFTDDIHPGQPMGLRQAWREIDRRGLWLALGNGLQENTYGFIWIIVLYRLVGDLVGFGGLVTVELLFTAAVSLVTGHYIDRGRAKWAARAGIAITALTIIARSQLVNTVPQIIASNFTAALGGALLSMPYMVAFYNMGQRSHNTLWFHFFAEAGWDIGGAISMLVAAGLFTLGVSLTNILLVGLVGLVIVDRVLETVD